MISLESLANVAFQGERALSSIFSYEPGDLPKFQEVIYNPLKTEFTGRELRNKIKVTILTAAIYAALC